MAALTNLGFGKILLVSVERIPRLQGKLASDTYYRYTPRNGVDIN